MARVTVEDCVLRIPNRFELVMLAAQRARDIASGAQLTVDRDRDRNPVVALREIADETVPSQDLKDAIVQGLQKHVEVDEPEDDEMEFGAAALQFEVEGVAAAEGEAEVPADQDAAGDDADEDEAAEDVAAEDGAAEDGASEDDASGDDQDGEDAAAEADEDV